MNYLEKITPDGVNTEMAPDRIPGKLLFKDTWITVEDFFEQLEKGVTPEEFIKGHDNPHPEQVQSVLDQAGIVHRLNLPVWYWIKPDGVYIQRDPLKLHGAMTIGSWRLQVYTIFRYMEKDEENGLKEFREHWNDIPEEYIESILKQAYELKIQQLVNESRKVAA